ncbi:MAG: hypothetical protein ACT6R6_12110 [Flavobacterium sp.]|uniref:hypothetical protein n=2 Tax=Flavobacterium sp. TaxID=239 RepID=UPI004033E55A
MLKAYSVLYRIALLLFVILMFATQMVVGVAGHNATQGVTEYIPLIYSVLTFATLWVYAEIEGGYLKQILRYVNILLVGTGVGVLLYFTIMGILNDGLIAGLIIAAMIIWIGIMLIYSLIKDGL